MEERSRATEAVIDIAKNSYPWDIEHPLDELCALYEYFTNIAPVDRLIEEVEIGLKKPNSLNGLKNFSKIPQ